jgi:hypothetical protein
MHNKKTVSGNPAGELIAIFSEVWGSRGRFDLNLIAIACKRDSASAKSKAKCRRELTSLK